MKKWLFGAGVILLFFIFLTSIYLFTQKREILSPLGEKILEKPLDKYTFEHLKRRSYQPSEIKIEKYLKDSAWIFSFQSDGKRVSGVINLPKNVSTTSAFLKNNSVVIMIHGSASQEEYYPGFGTQPVATVLAQNGYVTIAPDLLGYATSDQPSSDAFENRFETYTTVLNLMATVQVNCKLKISNCKLMLWGHSNGGQIALSVLEISGVSYPTALWAPVSKHFPYNILYYTDTYEDQGKWLRKVLANFEENYDVDKYDTALYLDWIKAPILLQQGSADPWVPQSWSDELYAQFKKYKSLKVEYKIYPGADHNLQPKWNQAVADLLSWYNKH